MSYLLFQSCKKVSDREWFSEPLFRWEKCLYVRAERARTSMICLSNSHLIFIYEVDTAEDALFENDWSRKLVDDFQQTVNGSPLGAATPVNIPPDESGEGGGVELIGSCENDVDFMYMLEDGFRTLEEEMENVMDNLSF